MREDMVMEGDKGCGEGGHSQGNSIKALPEVWLHCQRVTCL